LRTISFVRISSDTIRDPNLGSSLQLVLNHPFEQLQDLDRGMFLIVA
jgi:hypothetical protein